MNHIDNACMYKLSFILTGALQEILSLNPPSFLEIPPQNWKRVQGSQKDLPRAQKSDRCDPKKKVILRHTHKKYI